VTSRLCSIQRPARFPTALIAAVVAVSAASAPCPASAATQIGETFVPTGTCGFDTVFLQSGAPGGQYVAPSAGVITSWSFQASASQVPELKFKVARHAGGDNFTIVGEEGPRTPAPSTLNTYPARISVQGEDVIGLSTVTTGRCVRGAPGYGFHSAGGDPAPGTSFPASAASGGQLDVSASLEPDCDSDGFGDETQDTELIGSNCPPPPAKADGTLTIDANKGKVEKGRKVTLTGQLDVASNESCEPGRQIQIQRRLKSEDDSKFATFETATTEAAGNFTLKVKVKKTYFYRAVIAETDACDDETSNSQKVRVQKQHAAQEA